MDASSRPPLQWQAQALWQRLSPLLPGLSVEVVARTDSTNTQLLERARSAVGRRAGDLQPTLLVAEAQTAGRGRQGRAWHALPGRSLTFSLALPLQPPDWSALSLAVGVVLAEALDPQGGRIGLKWPNDLWLRDGPGCGRKLAGVLVETAPVAGRRLAVVGIGVNVLPDAAGAAVPRGAAGASAAGATAATAGGFDALPLASGQSSVHEIDPTVDAPAVLAQLAEPLVRGLLRFEREGFAPFLDGFARRDLLHGQAVLTSGSPPLAGCAEGVDAGGALRLRDAHGALHRLVSGEVRVRLSAGASAGPEPRGAAAPPDAPQC